MQSFLEPGQPVGDMVHDIALDARVAARGFIHSRTGQLAARIQVNQPSRTGAYTNSSLMFTRTKYALYVHEGTGTIFPKRGKMLTIPAEKQGGGVNPSGGTLRKMWRTKAGKAGFSQKPFFTRRSISGQRGNPFLSKGLAVAMARFRV